MKSIFNLGLMVPIASVYNVHLPEAPTNTIQQPVSKQTSSLILKETYDPKVESLFKNARLIADSMGVPFAKETTTRWTRDLLHQIVNWNPSLKIVTTPIDEGGLQIEFVSSDKYFLIERYNTNETVFTIDSEGKISSEEIVSPSTKEIFEKIIA